MCSELYHLLLLSDFSHISSPHFVHWCDASILKCIRIHGDLNAANTIRENPQNNMLHYTPGRLTKTKISCVLHINGVFMEMNKADYSSHRWHTKWCSHRCLPYLMSQHVCQKSYQDSDKYIIYNAILVHIFSAQYCSCCCIPSHRKRIQFWHGPTSANAAPNNVHLLCSTNPHPKVKHTITALFLWISSILNKLHTLLLRNRKYNSSCILVKYNVCKLSIFDCKLLSCCKCCILSIGWFLSGASPKSKNTTSCE